MTYFDNEPCNLNLADPFEPYLTQIRASYVKIKRKGGCLILWVTVHCQNYEYCRSNYDLKCSAVTFWRFGGGQRLSYFFWQAHLGHLLVEIFLQPFSASILFGRLVVVLKYLNILSYEVVVRGIAALQHKQIFWNKTYYFVY